MSRETSNTLGMAPSGVSVELADLSRHYKDVIALNSMSLKAEPGELVVLLGPSGCGKTTALRAIAGLETLDGGTILIGGKDVTSLPVSKRNIGMVFQGYSLFPNMTVRQNVEFGLRVRKVKPAKRVERAMVLLELVGLTAQADRYTHQLSGGQQQRVALARALAVEPEVLLLDEPLSALDAKVRVQLREEIRRLQLELKITTFFVTHDQEEALALADRIAVIKSGRLEQFGTPLEVYSHPQTEFVAEFVGSVNRLKGMTEEPGEVKVAELGSLSYNIGAKPYEAGRLVEVLVRPENIAVTSNGHSDRWTVVQRSFMGSSLRLTIESPDGTTLRSVVPLEGSQDLEVGTAVTASPRGKALLVTDRGL